ncbi:S-adenosyl-L-methionine-dependent methyltransferase [Pluteus cervinus]|uniref:S-adenosyl-L-methionine-dependent methyltransferase n=1 Tax=Pluteus cervinus TaxID=181527 RepID=A0ACD3ASN9_9AGAR|nr:S-adenosyl-L-methionine-dependent methyltransferase [Pluteus cervinus]
MASNLVNIQEGDIVVHLGCGDGTNTLLLAKKTGATGYIIGLDISEETISLSRLNAKSQNLLPPHVAFVKASWAEDIPIASNTVGYVLSSGIMGPLSNEGNGHVLKEIYRILKPGGKVVWDDKRIFPEDQVVDRSASIPVDETGSQNAPPTSNLPELLQDAGFNPEEVDLTGIASKSSSEPTSQTSNISASSDTPLLRWWDAYPVVRSTSLPRITADALAGYFKDGSKTGTDYAVIDVRRNDHGGGHVRASHQWPAQTFHNELAKFYEEFGNTKEVIFYCGSSNGRGPRCAGWYQEYLDDLQRQGEDIVSKAVVLEGGVKAWLAKFGGDKTLVDHDL